MNGDVVCGQPKMKLRDFRGQEWSNPLCHHTARGGRKHTGREQKLEFAEGVVNILQRNVTNGLTQVVQR